MQRGWKICGRCCREGRGQWAKNSLVQEGEEEKCNPRVGEINSAILRPGLYSEHLHMFL